MKRSYSGFLRDDSFSKPDEVLHACVRDDDLIKLERLLASPRDALVELELRALPKQTYSSGNAGGWGSILHFAAWKGNIDAVRALLYAGANPKVLATLSCLPTEEGGNVRSPLHVAIEYGHRSVVEALWSFAGPVASEIRDDRDSLRYSYPCVAARAGHPGIVQDLLRWRNWGRGVEQMVLEVAARCWRPHVVNELLRLITYSQDDLTLSLSHAIRSRDAYAGELYHRPKITPAECLDQQVLIEQLIEAGADPNFQHHSITATPPPIILAANNDPDLTGVLRMLLEKGTDVNASDWDGDTALHVLTRGRSPWNSTAICLLLRHRANACIVNNKGITALQLAAQHAPEPYNFNFILERQLGSGKTTAVAAAGSTSESNESLLHFAALGGKRDTMEMLISTHSLDVNQETQPGGWTPLLYALLPNPREGNVQGLGTLCHSVQSARLLLSHGASPLVTTSEGWTCLHALSLHLDFGLKDGLAESLALELIRMGSPINPPPVAALPPQKYVIGEHFRRPRRQQLPLLHWAAQYGAVGVVKALIKHGADVQEKNGDGRTAAEVAERSDFLKDYEPGGGPLRKVMLEVLEGSKQF